MSFIRLAARSVFLPRHVWNVSRSQTRLPRYAEFSTGNALPKDAIESRILNVIKGFEKVDPTKVTTTSSFSNDLGLDSLDAVEVVMAVEEEFGIEIPDAEADEIQTVQQAIDYISKTPEAH